MARVTSRSQITRRSFLASTGAALAAPHVVCAHPAGDADVLIVGAGAAGLAAARECRRLGKTFILVEARDRIGGRVFTDTSLGQPFDAGARYIHWAERNPWTDVARDLGAVTRPDIFLPGGFRFYANGKPVPEADRNLRRQAFAALSHLLEDDAADVPDISLIDEVASRGSAFTEAAGGLARMALGEEPERVSARDYARLWSGDDLVVPGGYGALVQAYGAGLPVRLSTPVAAIRWDGQGIAAETNDGTIRARAAIVTVPPTVLASGAIRFIPELPASTRDALAGLGAGALTKIGLKFGGARFDVPADSDIFEMEAPGETFDFECWTFGRDIVVANFGGDHARRITADGDRAAVATTLDAFVRVVGSDARKSFKGGSVHAWHRDPYSLGCYSHCLPGHADARAKLAEPVTNRIFFAGEATGGEDFGGAMTAGGAFLAGQAAARKAAGV
ncbi:MAG: FAD-dependent oxidoreductase [Methylobacteriaceae bacterium]|nr:FAD-dependent oxidoreductase [Methylobacteriaceae bacterium]